MSALLSELKVLDFSTLLPGPFASMMLADLGANVLRVEAPNRPDTIRNLPPFDKGTSAWHAHLNRSKWSLTLDLKKPNAAEVVMDLVQEYDIVLEQFRPGVMERLGIGYETLYQVNPAIIYCAISGYGQTGPYKNRAGHDNNYLSLAGVMSHSGRKESGPAPWGVQVADVGGGSFGAITSILAAVIYRMQTGEGQHLDVSMFDFTLAWQGPAISHYLIAGQVPSAETSWLNGGSYYDFYQTQDRRYLSVGSLEPKFWHGFCTAIERPDLIPSGYNRNAEVQQQLKQTIQSVIVQKPLKEWMDLFAAVDVCVEPVLEISEAIAHPQTQARDMVVDVPAPSQTIQRQVGSPFKMSKHTPSYKHIGRPPGSDTERVLKEMGYSEEKIVQLKTQGVFGRV
ncbi:MAG: CaiB/BaiF CoA-transferase family protein [Chloroflexota bacterium]